PEKLKVRMTEYEERTMPVLDYFNQRNILIKVDGMPAQEIVFEDILLKLEGLEK
ncbi:TPA: adenylate kinase, partial [Candidatus Azambacteria bacterium]|nr:adenylate kinase [Candidatus Azambacteria bacterium]